MLQFFRLILMSLTCKISVSMPSCSDKSLEESQEKV